LIPTRFLARIFAEKGAARLSEIECKLKSGRKFRYRLSEYPITADLTESQAAVLARQIVDDKFRLCEWDRSHVGNDSEEEIFEAVKREVMFWVDRMREVSDEK
jgi:hypothetical protein